ncbi:uncharacterized protein LOC127835227 isoform X2 [Dreissena polymorpha]|uniref:uncharacterized protein LOC127835227 isoform X2 n=1 Tax=Dreissena polymorpha TaxID=45954 RepID=UPI0022650734|nr:uncharacterized protein LOC127835227 isoform X2 [Dreissena polymorpha]
MKCTICGMEGSQTPCAVCNGNKEAALGAKGNGETNTEVVQANTCLMCQLQTTNKQCTCGLPEEEQSNESTQCGICLKKQHEEPSIYPKPYPVDEDHSQSDASDSLTKRSGEFKFEANVNQWEIIYSREPESSTEVRLSGQDKQKVSLLEDTDPLFESYTRLNTIPMTRTAPNQKGHTIQRDSRMIKVTDADKYETVLVPSEMLRSETKESREPDNAFMKVDFHAYVSVQMLQKPEDKLYIQFDCIELGGVGSLRHEMKKVCNIKKFQTLFIEYEYSILLPFRLVQEKLLYKYFAYHLTSRKYYREKYTSDTECCDRTLIVCRDFAMQKAVWRQYDGIVVPEQNVFQKLYFSVVRMYTQFAKGYVNDLTPKLFAQPLNSQIRSLIGSDIESCIMLLDGVRRVYVLDMKCWETFNDFHKEVSEEVMLTNIIQEISSPSSKQSSTDRVLQALSVAIVCERVGISLKQSNWERVCECLILSVDSENTHVVEIESIRNCFEKSQIKDALQFLIGCVSNYDKKVQPSWLFCLPLLHIMLDICEPFVEPDPSLDISLESWWGTNDVLNVVKATCLKESNHLAILRLLRPLYKMDYFLSRTIAKTIQINDCRVLSSDLLSLDSVCAILLQEAIRGCPTTIMEEAYNNVVVRLKSKSSFDDDDGSEGRCWVAYQIAYRFARQHSRTDSPNLLLNCLHIFLHCVARYDNILRVKHLATNVNSEHVEQHEHLDHVKEIADSCLGQLPSMKYSNLFEYLKTWKLAFPKTLPSKRVRTIWINAASITFKVACFHCIKFFQTDNFLEHYCSGEGKYSQPMYTCLTTVAFKVIESGKLNLNSSNMAESMIPKYTALLSELFQRHWGSFSSTTDVERVLEHALNWVPMKPFIEYHIHIYDLLTGTTREK